MSEDIEFSKEGIKISYIRFLADAGAGFLIVLIFIYAYFMYIPKQDFDNIPNEIWILISVLLFLLSFPLGVITNGASYFLLGWMQEFLVQLCIEERTLCLVIGEFAGFTKRKFNSENIFNKFHINREENNFYQISQDYERLLSIKYPDVSKQFGYIIGCSRLSRNFALLDIGIFSYLIISNPPVSLSVFVSWFFLITPLIVIFFIKILYLHSGLPSTIKFYQESKKNQSLKRYIKILLILLLIGFCFYSIITHHQSLFTEGTFLLSLFYCYLIFAFFIGISSLLEFYYYINILHVSLLANLHKATQ